MSTRIAAVILAAGTASRMGANKLLLPFDGTPMLNHAIDAALYSQVCRTVVVAGHNSAAIIRLCSEYTTHIAHNPDYIGGMASSIRVGIDALPADIDAALIMLGDMPYVTAMEIDRLIEAHRAAPASICVPQYCGRRGNPLLWPRRFFPALQQLEGDAGARSLLTDFAEHVQLVDFDSPAVLLDCDTPETFQTPASPDFQRFAQSKRY
jgi:molybdenum cofactor cytidylyltransferase